MQEKMNKSQRKITALSSGDLVRLLKGAGCRTVTEETLTSDVESGAPINPDGTFNLIKIAAYLAKDTDDAAN